MPALQEPPVVNVPQDVTDPKPVAPDGYPVDPDFLRRPLVERLANLAVWKNDNPRGRRMMAGLVLREDDSVIDVACALIEAAQTAEVAAQQALDDAYRTALRQAGVKGPPRRFKLNLPTLSGSLRGLALANEAPGRCATCAFRRGTPANCSEETTYDAKNCVEGGDDFLCHEHDPDDEHLCRGFVQARRGRG
ncbi:hypothetical protein [Alienimonas sp. DA493]|uniref:hypothetical protein n=1 Tax=Alienimonas sp. DA493 TaxID=3373605 RepID=UPI00375416DC